MLRDRIAKRVYVGECACTHSVGRPQKRWIDTVKEYLWPSLQLKGIKGKFSVFLLSPSLLLFYCSSFLGMVRADPVVVEEGRSLINKLNKLN